MVKNENDMNHGNSLLKTATSRKFGASKMALTALRSGARPPIKKVKVPKKSSQLMDGSESRVSDLTGSIIEAVGTKEHTVIKEIHVHDDFDVESSILGFSVDGDTPKNNSGSVVPTTTTIPSRFDKPTRPDPIGVASPVAFSEPLKKKTMEIEKGISISAPSPMSLDRVHVQGYVQEHVAPESIEYRIQQEAFLKRQQENAAKKEEEEKKIQAKLRKREEIVRGAGEGFEAQLGDFSIEHVQTSQNNDQKRGGDESECIPEPRHGKKKSLVKKLLGKIKPKSPRKIADHNDDQQVSAIGESKRKQLDSRDFFIDGKGFPVAEIVMNSKDTSSVSDLDASGRQFPVSEISTKDPARRQPDDVESVSTLGTPHVFESVPHPTNSKKQTQIESIIQQRQDAEAGGAGPFFASALGDPSAEDPPDIEEGDTSEDEETSVDDREDNVPVEPLSPPLSPSSTFKNALDAAIAEAQRRLVGPNSKQDPETMSNQSKADETMLPKKTLSPIIEIEETKSPLSSAPVSPTLSAPAVVSPPHTEQRPDNDTRARTVTQSTSKANENDDKQLVMNVQTTGEEEKEVNQNKPGLLKVLASVGSDFIFWGHSKKEPSKNENDNRNFSAFAEDGSPGIIHDTEKKQKNLQKAVENEEDPVENGSLHSSNRPDSLEDVIMEVATNNLDPLTYHQDVKAPSVGKPIIFGEPVPADSMKQAIFPVVRGVDLKLKGSYPSKLSVSPKVKTSLDLPLVDDEEEACQNTSCHNSTKNNSDNKLNMNDPQVKIFKGDNGDDVLMYAVNPFGLMQRSPTEQRKPSTTPRAGNNSKENKHSERLFAEGLFDLLSADERTPRMKNDQQCLDHINKESVPSYFADERKLQAPQIISKGDAILGVGGISKSAQPSQKGDSYKSGGDNKTNSSRDENNRDALGYALGCSELIVCGRSSRLSADSEKVRILKNENTGEYQLPGIDGDSARPFHLGDDEEVQEIKKKSNKLNDINSASLIHTRPSPEDCNVAEELLDKHDPYWDTLSTIASTKDRSTILTVEHGDSSYGNEPRPIPVEILMKTKTSKVDRGREETAHHGIIVQKNQGHIPAKADKPIEQKRDDRDDKAEKTSFVQETKELKSLLDATNIVDLNSHSKHDEEEMMQQRPQHSHKHLSRFGSRSAEDDSIQKPPSLRSSSYSQESNHGKSSLVSKRNNRVASLIARFEDPRDDIKLNPRRHSGFPDDMKDAEESLCSEDNSALILNVTRSDQGETDQKSSDERLKNEELSPLEVSSRSARSQFSAPTPESPRFPMPSSRSSQSLTPRAILERMQFQPKNANTAPRHLSKGLPRLSSPKIEAPSSPKGFPASNRSVSWGYEEIYEPPRTRNTGVFPPVQENVHNDNPSTHSASSYSMGESLGLDDHYAYDDQLQKETRIGGYTQSLRDSNPANSFQSSFSNRHGQRFDSVPKTLSTTKDFDNSSYVDMENEEREGEISYDEEEQALIARTLELSKALLASMTVEDLESDDEMAKSIMSLGTADLLGTRSATSLWSDWNQAAESWGDGATPYEGGYHHDAGEGSSESPFQVDYILSKYDGFADGLMAENSELQIMLHNDEISHSNCDDLPNGISDDRLQHLRAQRASALEKFESSQNGLRSVSAKERNHLPRYTVGDRNGSPQVNTSSLVPRFDQEETEVVSVSSTSSSRSAPSKKARLLRKQLDDALKASKEIRQSNENLGAELRDFKSKFYQKNNEIEDSAKHAIGNL